MKFLKLKYRDQELSDREINIAVLGFCFGYIAGSIVLLLITVF